MGWGFGTMFFFNFRTMRYSLFLILATTFVSCKDEKKEHCDNIGQMPVIIDYCESDENFSNTPLLENPTLSRNQVSGNIDSLTVKFRFKDGDGDIGKLAPNTTSYYLCDLNNINEDTFSRIFVEDSRTRCFFLFNTNVIPVASGSVSGSISLVISSICCIYPDIACIPSTQYPADTVIFKISMKDRTGNISNTIETPPIYINCNF
jgi:hypothetical protein